MTISENKDISVGGALGVDGPEATSRSVFSPTGMDPRWLVGDKIIGTPGPNFGLGGASISVARKGGHLRG